MELAYICFKYVALHQNFLHKTTEMKCESSRGRK